MNRIFILLALVGLYCGQCEAEELGGTNELRILVKVSKADVRVGEAFKVSLQVENPTPTNQYVFVWGCSWATHWKSDITNVILIDDQECAANTVGRIEIKPGGAQINEGHLQILHPVAGNKLSFRMGFTPFTVWDPVRELYIQGKTSWSHEILIRIIP